MKKLLFILSLVFACNRNDTPEYTYGINIEGTIRTIKHDTSDSCKGWKSVSLGTNPGYWLQVPSDDFSMKLIGKYLIAQGTETQFGTYMDGCKLVDYTVFMVHDKKPELQIQPVETK